MLEGILVGIIDASLLRKATQFYTGVDNAGINELIAEVLGSNLAMLKVFEKSGLQITTRREGPVIHVTLKFASA